MNAEELKALGIEDADLQKKIIIAHGKDIESIKAERDTALATSKDFEGKFQEAAKQIEGFKDMKKPEEVEAAVKDWQTKYEQAQAEKANAINQLKYDTTIENALRDAKAKSLKAARALLDETELKLGEDGKVSGLDERVKKAVSENSWAFGEDESRPKPRRVVSKTSSAPPELEDKQLNQIRQAAGLPVKEK